MCTSAGSARRSRAAPGACAAAAAAYDLGLVGDRVVVYQPGGAAVVELGDDTVTLTGPAVHVATIEAYVA